MGNSESASSPHRLQALDSLRGIAAFTVLLGHTLAVCDWDTSFSRLPIINNLFDGRSAVTMFFVLSGFVLTFGSLRTGKPMLLVPFYLRRLTRIWLPWFAVFCLSIAAKACIFAYPSTTHPPLSQHHLQFWSNPNSATDLAKQLFFHLHDAKRMFLPQDWSLGVELKGSFMIPLLLLLARKSRGAVLIAGIVFLLIKPAGGYYYASFVVGVLIAELSVKVRDFRFPGVIALLGFILYQARWASEFFSPSFFAEREIWMTGAIGCGLLIFGVLKCSALRDRLEIPPLAFLGKVSYSCYLLQAIVLVCAAPWIISGFNHLGVMSPGILQILLLVTVAATCLSLSWLSERWIEVPCIKLGKLLSTKVERNPHLARWKI